MMFYTSIIVGVESWIAMDSEGDGRGLFQGINVELLSNHKEAQSGQHTKRPF
jgi:hypothetical protein